MNNKYNLISKEDIKEIDDVLDFAEGLIIKDVKKADQEETVTSLRTANQVITSALNKADSNDEIDNIMKNYKDLNPYYIELKEKYNISYYKSRTARDFAILESTNKTLNREDTALFYECYYEVLEYHKKVISTRAFESQTKYRSFIKLFIIFSTVQRYLTRKMDSFFDVDVYDLKRLKNAFISVGLDYFDNMPANYQRRLLKMVNTLLSHKGTNLAIKEIINLFGFKNMDIFKYILVKGYGTDRRGQINYQDPRLFFYKTPADEEINPSKNMRFDYKSITSQDPYWQASEDQIKSMEFNSITSKYMSIDSSIDAIKETLNLSYFMSLLKKFEEEYKDKHGIDIGFINKKISLQSIDLFDSIIALQSLIIRSHGYKDLINKNPDSINFIYGYNDIENKIDIKEFVKKIEDILLKYPNTEDHETINSFLKDFKMSNFEDKENYTINSFLEVFNNNESIRNSLEDLIVKTNNYYIFRELNKIWDLKMKSKINNDIYGNNETFLDFLKEKNYELHNYIIPPDFMDEKQRQLFFKEKIFELTESIANHIGDLKLRKSFLNNNFIGLNSYIEEYLYTIVSLFKSYTIDLLSANVIFSLNDKRLNTIKLFDHYQGSTYSYEAERVDIIDICNILDGNKLLLKEEFLDEKLYWTSSLKDQDILDSIYDDKFIQSIYDIKEKKIFNEKYSLFLDYKLNNKLLLNHKINKDSKQYFSDTGTLREHLTITVGESGEDDRIVENINY
ncbi:hypothetical protein Bp8pS_317 [Bacillus phage vB_BpuM-BpSp]|nr:hypothetical protein Bp8pS_317 [Bacillus phage vB_BpuM-BpSp]